MAKHLVFVYGSLKKGYHNHYLLANSELISRDANTCNQFKMISLGSFPAMVAGDKSYQGELYEVDDKVFQDLDYLEGYPEFYTRKQYTILWGHDCNSEAWVYTLANEERVKDTPPINGNSW